MSNNPSMRTPEEIETEVSTLRQMKPNVLKMSGFGEDHHAAIDAQIRVMKEVMSEDDIYDSFEPTGDDDIDGDEDRSEHSHENALYAYEWMMGREDRSPSEEWKELVR